ncbi:hypothetical protein GCM10028808_18250 [Spirosoma migulaei]
MTAELLDCTPQEQECLQGCRGDNPKAQEMVFKRYYSLVYGICIRYLSSKELAQEVVNDCFFKLFHQLKSTYPNPTYFRPWLRQLAVHTAIDAYRKEKPYLHQSTIDDLVTEVGYPEYVHDSLNAEQILSLVALLPDLWRLTFNLYEVEGYAHEEIAVLLNIPVSSSRVYLTRAKQRLRELLGQHNAVRTYMPIYYTSSADRPEDPDWAHFRETLRSYEPVGDPNAWSRFQKFQRGSRSPKQGRLYKLILLTTVAIICEKSQHIVPHWLPTQAAAITVKAGTIATSNSQQGPRFVVEEPEKQSTFQSAKADSAELEPVAPGLKMVKTDAITPSSLVLVPAGGLSYTATSIGKRAEYKVELADKIAFETKKSLPTTTTLKPFRKEESHYKSASTTVIQAQRSRGRGSSAPIHVRLLDDSRFDYQENRWVGALKNSSTAKTPPYAKEPLSKSLGTSKAGGRLPETTSTSAGLVRLQINKLATRPLSFNHISANIPARIHFLPQVSVSPKSKSVERPVFIGAIVGMQAAYIPQGKPTWVL